MGMKRKVGLFLFAVMLAVSVGATIVASLAMYRLVSDKQDNEIRRLEDSLSDRFAVFETMLRSQHERIVAHMEKVVPEIAREFEASDRDPAELSVAELDALTRKYDVQHIYFIDRSHKVFQTNLASDMNLAFPESDFTHFLDSVYGAGKVMNDGIDMSSLTGTLRTYSYLGPKGKDYIIEISTEVRASLADGDFGWMSDLFFRDLFSDAVRSNPYVKEVDLYLVTPAGIWSLLHVGKKLDPALAQRVQKDRREEVAAGDGRIVTVYSGEETRAATDPGHPVSSKFVIRQITYDTGLAGEAVLQVLVSSMLVLAVLLPIVFWIASRLLQKQLLDPLFNLRGEAGAIAQGYLEQAIANTERTDEIGQLAKSFASMRDAVRRTIVDLRDTNLSIERFVPHAFLSIIGKPSIVDVALGDNKREKMSILFSDIRSFTTLSESMPPDENFAFINAYLERMGPVIRDHHGFIDKYIGDAIMALFGNADDAVQAGLAMLAALEIFNEDRRAAGLQPIAIGVGINTGLLMLGTIGEKDRMDGTVISDAVNLAARVESLTKEYRQPLLISEYTLRELIDPGAYDVRPVDVVVVKGKTRPVAIYAVSPSSDSPLHGTGIVHPNVVRHSFDATTMGKDMTSRADMEKTIRSLYAARIRGDLDGTLKDVAEDAVFSLNGRGTGVPAMSQDCCGKPAVRESVEQLIGAWRFDDWKETALLIDGNRVALQWAARVTFAPTSKSATMEAVDMITFRDGKIVEFRQSTDTAMLMSLAS